MDTNSSRRVSDQRLKNLEILRLYLKCSQFLVSRPAIQVFHFEVQKCNWGLLLFDLTTN